MISNFKCGGKTDPMDVEITEMSASDDIFCEDYTRQPADRKGWAIYN